MDTIAYVGLDVHKATIAVAVAEGGRGGEIRQVGVFENRPAILMKLAARLSKGGRRLSFCCEAGPASSAAKELRSASVKREFRLRHPCPATGRTSGGRPGYVKDHVVPLACGGPDAVSNLQWQTVRDAKAEDKWETKGCAR